MLLALADDKLMLGHRNSDWTGLGPILEEDIAFSSIAQDEMGHAQAVYDLVGARMGTTADRLAFGRSPDEYLCAAIVEMPDEFDWSTAICRRLFCDHFDELRLRRLAASSDAEVAALAARMRDEERVHVEHVDDWIRRLGRGTDESRDRVQAALDAMAPHASGLLEPVEGEDEAVSSGLYPALDEGDMFTVWRDGLAAVTEAGGLTLDLQPPAADARRGRHSEHFTALLDEMCEVFRIEPNAAW